MKKQQHHQVANRSRSPAGPRRLGTATRISTSLSRRLSAFFGSTLDQTLKAAKFAVLPPGHAGFPKRAERSEGSDTTPHPKHHLFRRVCPCVRFFSESRVCYPLSLVKANVGHLWEKLKTRQETVGDKIYGGSFAGFFSSADSGGSQRTGKCMYIKAWRNKKFRQQQEAALWTREGRPLFRRVGCLCRRC